MQAREDKSWRVGWIKALVEVQKSYKVEELRGKNLTTEFEAEKEGIGSFQ